MISKSLNTEVNSISHNLKKISDKFFIKGFQTQSSVLKEVKQKLNSCSKVVKYSSSSCCVTSTDLTDPFLPSIFINHHSWLVFKATSCISTELLYIDSSWSSCLCFSMWRSPQEYVTYEFLSKSRALLA